MLRLCIAPLLAGLCAAATAADLPFVNWENHPQHALDRSPDGRLLAVAHTADQRVQLFDIRAGEPVPAGHVVVGVDPVSVRFRTASELWVVNHVSDSISIVDVAARRVAATLSTADEPFDVVFANGRAFVSCSQANAVQVFEVDDLARAPVTVPIAAEDPRGLAVSRDGRSVYAAIFESGNATTLLAGGLVDDTNVLPNVVSDPRGPYGGQNPPPNAGAAFEPPLDPQATPPRVGLIVRRHADGRWRDDNLRDWSDFVGGPLALASGRRAGWDLPDRDLAIIDTATLAVRYRSGLLNIGMALAVHPPSGEIDVIGTEAFNEVRYEPNVNGRFVRAHLARVAADGASARITDLNPHLDYRQPTVAQSLRDQSVGDPRALAWSADGQRGWSAGMGSNNVVPIAADGSRRGPPMDVGAGPVALALDEARQRLYVWNHFDASLSVIDSDSERELQRVGVFDPLPAAIRNGRPLLYDTHRTSGLGQVACASCHVDARMDRLAWDLGDPSLPPAPFDQNCITTVFVAPCTEFHAMKGPMTTQTLQDIVGHEPFHWRGDRAGIEAFNPAFVGLLGDDAPLTAGEMQAFEDFLATIAFPPNPYRGRDNSLPRALPLTGHYTSGRFAMAGQPLGTGDAVRGLTLYTRNVFDPPFQCANCHTLPTGMAVNGPSFVGLVPFSLGGEMLPTGPNGENHLGIVSVDGSTNRSIKVPHLRNQHEKVGFDLTRGESLAGFGFLHDGSVDTLARFMSARGFSVRSDQDIADLVALMLAFAGSDFGPEANPFLGAATPPPSRDTHAAVGLQATYAGGAVPAAIADMLALARAGAVDVVVHAGADGYAYERAGDRFASADGAAQTVAAVQQRAEAAHPQTWTVVPRGLGVRLGVDRDGDGIGDRAEIAQGSNPADAQSTTLRAAAGPWFDPQRAGHGLDVQHTGAQMAVTWYTYLEDGTPAWYLAVGAHADPWRADLQRYRWDAGSGRAVATTVGTITLDFDDARHARFDWRLGAHSGSERVETLFPGTGIATPDRTGVWYDPREAGWGVGLYSEGDLRSAVVYFYDGSGQPRWVLGQGDNAANATLAMLRYRGFCPQCPATATSVSGGGTIDIAFDGARRAMLRTDVDGGDGVRWRRSDVRIEALSDAVVHPGRL